MKKDPADVALDPPDTPPKVMDEGVLNSEEHIDAL